MTLWTSFMAVVCRSTNHLLRDLSSRNNRQVNTSSWLNWTTRRPRTTRFTTLQALVSHTWLSLSEVRLIIEWPAGTRLSSTNK